MAHPYPGPPRPAKLRSRTSGIPGSRPMSPQEQLNVMHGQEEKIKALQTEPDARDLEASGAPPTQPSERGAVQRSAPPLPL